MKLDNIQAQTSDVTLNNLKGVLFLVAKSNPTSQEEHAQSKFLNIAYHPALNASICFRCNVVLWLTDKKNFSLVKNIYILHFQY